MSKGRYTKLDSNNQHFICVYTFHCSRSVFLVPLAFLGAFGRSGSQLNVVKLTASEGLPCKQLQMAWTLRNKEEWLE